MNSRMANGIILRYSTIIKITSQVPINFLYINKKILFSKTMEYKLLEGKKIQSKNPQNKVHKMNYLTL